MAENFSWYSWMWLWAQAISLKKESVFGPITVCLQGSTLHFTFPVLLLWLRHPFHRLRQCQADSSRHFFWLKDLCVLPMMVCLLTVTLIRTAEVNPCLCWASSLLESPRTQSDSSERHFKLDVCPPGNSLGKTKQLFFPQENSALYCVWSLSQYWWDPESRSTRRK